MTSCVPSMEGGIGEPVDVDGEDRTCLRMEPMEGTRDGLLKEQDDPRPSQLSGPRW